MCPWVPQLYHSRGSPSHIESSHRMKVFSPSKMQGLVQQTDYKKIGAGSSEDHLQDEPRLFSEVSGEKGELY